MRIADKMFEVIATLSEIIAEMEMEGMTAAADSVRTVEGDLIWQWHELTKFDTT